MSTSTDGIQEKIFSALWGRTERLKFVKEHENMPDEYREHIHWSEKITINLLGSYGDQRVWCVHSDCIVLIVKPGGGSVMI